MMTEMMVLALLAGVVLGVLFFGGLWWTVRKGLVAKTPAAWFLMSFLLRMSFVLSGFYWVAQYGSWQYLAIALLGFIIARMVLIRITPSPWESEHVS